MKIFRFQNTIRLAKIVNRASHCDIMIKIWMRTIYDFIKKVPRAIQHAVQFNILLIIKYTFKIVIKSYNKTFMIQQNSFITFINICSGCNETLKGA